MRTSSCGGAMRTVLGASTVAHPRTNKKPTTLLMEPRRPRRLANFLKQIFGLLSLFHPPVSHGSMNSQHSLPGAAVTARSFCRLTTSGSAARFHPYNRTIMEKSRLLGLCLIVNAFIALTPPESRAQELVASDVNDNDANPFVHLLHLLRSSH